MEENQIIFGRKPLLEALKQPEGIEKIYIDRTLKGPYEKEVRHIAKTRNIPISRVPQRSIEKMARGNHQGIVAIGALVRYQDAETLIRRVQQGECPFVLVLDHITDVRNMGAIFRSAYFFGFEDILLPIKGTAEINKDAMKSSAGALAHVRLYRASNLMDCLDALKNIGIQVISLESKGGKTMDMIKWDRTKPQALIIGSEGHGVTKEMLHRSDHRLYIPGSDQFDSLNVSVATGIALYEMSKLFQ